ncbi:MAG TPA: FHA domain-containing protein [Blastocatellia bacterium]|jgi:hypothetical protein|nr:FHA domain-containing protein [Blastocatellia bacterium]
MSNAKLTIRSIGKPDREVIIPGVISIGRASDNSVCIDNANVSRYHALIEPRADGYWLSDLRSRNGTSVNGAAVASDRRLEDGDSISIGNASTLEFHLDESRADPRADSAEASASQSTADETLPAQQSPAAEAARKPTSNSTGQALMIGAAVIVAVALVAGAALLLIPSQRGGNAPPITESARGGAGDKGPTETQAGKNNDGRVSTSEAEVARPPEPDAGNTKSGGNLEPGLIEIRYMAEGLARMISGQSGNVFAADFVKQISRSTRDYQIDVIKDAQPYSRDIKAAFNNKALPPTLGLILAMSQSKFKAAPGGPESGGLWHVPFAIARERGYLKEGETEAGLKDPARSAQVAAAYVRDLVGVFGGKENFMYAIACYGEPLNQAGEMRTRLDDKDPSGAARLDFWKMVNSGVVSQAAAARVARFFAAGIVGENPEKFGLNTQSLSSLVTS